ncbi:MAG: YbaB/EbfC family nucleoid-associated protein [Alphaproteobacteria bacterium]|nr:YbaB/EbfC family nucleoid-associated protein [Alphaproteobacteria bacterium]
MKNLSQMMKQAQEMQAKMQEMQERLDEAEITGTAGAGLVTVTLTGKGTLRKLKIDPSVVDPNDTAMLEDLITAAFNDAKTKVEAFVAEKMSEVTGGLQLPPGMKLPF